MKNDIKLLSADAKSVKVALFDGERWLEIQLQMAHRYAKFLLGLAKKGTLTLPAKALQQMLLSSRIPAEAKMITISRLEGKNMNTDTRQFLSSVTDDLDDLLSVKSLSRRGFDSDGETITREGVPLWPVSVLKHDDDVDSSTKAFNAQIRTTLDPAYSRAFAHYLNLSFKNRSRDMGFNLLSVNERKALMEGNDSAGGYLVPAEILSTVLSRVTAKSVVRAGARVIPTTRDKLVLPEFAAHGSLPSVYSSGFVGTWVGEQPLWADDDPSVGTFEAPIKKLRVGVKLSRDLMDDAGGVGWLTSNGADNIAAGEDQVFINGANNSYEPQGILNGGITTVDVEGSTANTLINTVSNAGSAPKLLTLAGSLPGQYQRDAVLITASPTEASINKLTDANGSFLFPRRRGPDGRRELLGYPTENSPFMPLDGTDAAKVVLIGDLSGYVVSTRSMISLVLRERFADEGKIGVILSDRIGGAVYNVDAFRAGVV